MEIYIVIEDNGIGDPEVQAFLSEEEAILAYEMIDLSEGGYHHEGDTKALYKRKKERSYCERIRYEAY